MNVTVGTTPDIDVVAWTSEHLAALEQVVYPAARRVLPDPTTLHAQQVRTHALGHALRRLHQRISGDGAAMHLPIDRLRNDVRELVAAHEEGERELEDQLRAVVSEAAWDELQVRYQRAAAAAPTRPHPHAPHSGWTGRVVQSVLASVDRVLDALDARPVHEAPAAG